MFSGVQSLVGIQKDRSCDLSIAALFQFLKGIAVVILAQEGVICEIFLLYRSTDRFFAAIVKSEPDKQLARPHLIAYLLG